MKPILPLFSLFFALASCGSDGSSTPNHNTSEAPYASGRAFSFAVPATGRGYLNLASKSVVQVDGDPKASRAWDLAFDGIDIYTNSGVSGGGAAASFGPLDVGTFASDVMPAIPYLATDKSGGAFLDWYTYEGAPTHALWSRYHVFGVKDGSRLWKVQILTYYGERDGAPVSGLYKLRYAELTPSGVGDIKEISNIDGTAGGSGAPANSPSECLDLGTGKLVALSPDTARTSYDWHLCFRRQTIGINGDQGGPRGVGAVDLMADAIASEEVAEIRKRTADSERGTFDAVTAASFHGKTFRGDRIISGFGEGWLEAGTSVLRPKPGTWIAVDAAGATKYFLAFERFEQATATSPGTIFAHIKALKE